MLRTSGPGSIAKHEATSRSDQPDSHDSHTDAAARTSAHSLIPQQR